MLDGDVDLTLVPRDSLFARLLAMQAAPLASPPRAAVEKHGFPVTVESSWSLSAARSFAV